MNTKPPHANRAFRKRVSGAARRVFVQIAEVWALSDIEQVNLLALDSLEALEQLRQPSKTPLSHDVLIRISNVLKVYRALHILLPRAENAHGWVKRPNTNVLFGGKPALCLMTTRDLADLTRVREYLEAQIDPQWG
ncbi:MAG: antitoxin Xre/MbcA/ParS toxin-binding domain-containing protein [Pseudomonadota bacterium]